MRSCISILITSALAISCTSRDPETLSSGGQGLAEIQVDAAALLSSGITRVTVEAAGETQDLVLNPASGTFDGTLFLPSGSQSLVARAFAGEALIGLSRPTSIEVTTGIVTRVLVRILDLTPQAPPVYGPIFDSLTYPTTALAGAAASFAAAVVAPLGDPVTYSWTSDCQDASFSTPQAAATGWSKAAEGACTINVVATSNGFSVAQSFVIVVFPAGSGSGAVNVSGVFVTAPTLFLAFPDLGCFPSFSANASCPGASASPAAPAYQVSVVNWGSSAPGTLEVSDSCGGRFGTSSQSVGFLTGNWLPPVGGGVCILTARAVNGDELAGTASAAILAHAGTPAMSQPPQISAQLSPGCALGTPAIDCGPIPAGSQVVMFGNVSWGNGLPGTLTITDDCGGSQPAPGNTTFLNNAWIVPSTPGTTCTTTVLATSLQGASSEVSAHYHLQ